MSGTYRYDPRSSPAIPYPDDGQRPEPRDAAPDLPDPGPGAGADRPRAVRAGRVPAPRAGCERRAGRRRIRRGGRRRCSTSTGCEALRWPRRRRRTCVPVSRAGETFGIAGPNGAGKTTLFDTITGHARATGGAIRSPARRSRTRTSHVICQAGDRAHVPASRPCSPTTRSWRTSSSARYFGPDARRCSPACGSTTPSVDRARGGCAVRRLDDRLHVAPRARCRCSTRSG